ncbi:GAF domain-containing protein [Streptomyces sp. NPDC057694]|uniref:GAF domain-containing protein n=1 Tax=Streptomyces sp. NPDC057694 TaxID=3346216 RepID=UPI0036D02E14
MVWSVSVPGIEVSVAAQPERTVVHVTGRLDQGGVVALRQQLSDHDRCLVLDFSRVSFVGLAGVALVEAVAEQVRAAGGELEVWGVDDPVLRQLHESGRLRALRRHAGTGAETTDRAQSRNRLVMREALAAALRVTGAPMGNAQLLDPDSQSLRITDQRGFHQPFLHFFRRVEAKAHGSTCGAAAEQRRAVYVEDVRVSPLFVGTPAAEVLKDAGVYAVASLPVLSASGDLAGMLSTHFSRPTTWTPEVRRELEYVAEAAGRLIR